MAKERCFTFLEFIAHCGISKTKGYKLLQSGKIPYTKTHGGFYYSIPASSVYSYKHMDLTAQVLLPGHFIMQAFQNQLSVTEQAHKFQKAHAYHYPRHNPEI